MEICIKNFRSVSSQKVKIEKGLTLLNGKSGAGKTTILESIQWCLYGNVREIRPINAPKAKVKVRIKTSSLKITRTTNPNKLIVENDENVYMDQSAQGIVNSEFGEYTEWSVSSYLKQKSIPSFLSSSPKNKWKILNSVAFPDTNPSEHIAKIEEEILVCKNSLSELKSEQSIAKALYKESFCKFKESHGKNPLKCKNKSKDISSASSLLNKTKSLLQEKRNIQRKRYKIQGQIDGITKNLEKISDEEDFDSVTFAIAKPSPERISYMDVDKTKLEQRISEYKDLVSDYDISMKKWQNNKNVSEKLERMTRSIDDLMSECKIKPESQYSSHDISKSRKNHLLREAESKSIKSLCKYDKLDAKNTIQALESEAEKLSRDLDQTSTNDKIEDARKRISKIGDVEDISSEEIESQTLKVNMLKLPLVECPGCGAKLRNKGTSLHLNMEAENIEKESVILDEMRKRRAKLDLKVSIELELSKLGEYKDLDKTGNEISKCMKETQNKIRLLKSLKFPEKHLDHREMKKCNKILKLRSQLSKLPQIKDLKKPEPIIRISNELSKLEKQLSAKNRYDSLISNLESNKKHLQLLPSTDLKIKELEDDVRKCSLDLLICKEARSVRMLKISLNKKSEICLSEEERLSHLESLLSKAKKIQSDGLLSLSNTITSTINAMLMGMFEDPISVSLNLTKKLKTKDVIRDVVNLTVSYRGRFYSSVKQMSGGEADRLSIAFQVAMCKIFGGKILMLDEAIPSMESDVKHSCREFLKTHSKNIFTIYIGHNEIKGDFEHVINVKHAF